MEQAQVKDIMTEKVISIHVDTPITDVIRILIEKGFSGLPVVDKENKLIGLITEYSFINSSHLKKSLKEIEEDAEELADALAEEVMNAEPLTLYFDDTYEDALALFSKHHSINPVPVIDRDNKLVGVVSRFDLIKLLRLYGHS